MAMFSVNTHRFDPYRNFKFRVIVDGRPVPAISYVSPLRRTTEAALNRSGSDTNQFRVTPGLSAFEPIVIERGLSHDPTFENWANQVFNMQGDAGMSLKNYRKDIRIELLNLQGAVVLAYHIFRCWVSEYQALPELDANGQSAAVERIVLQHEGWERDRDVSEPAET